MRLHQFAWERLSADFVHRVVFHNHPGMRPVVILPRHRRWSVRILQRGGRLLLSPFLWPRRYTMLDASREWVLEMELDPDEQSSADRKVIIAEVTRFAAGEAQCGRWAYSHPGIWRCLDSYDAPLEPEDRARYENYYYLQTGERVTLPSPQDPAVDTPELKGGDPPR